MPEVSDRKSIAYRSISTSGTWARTSVRPDPDGSVPVTLARRVDRSPITAPTSASGTSTLTASTGSSRESCARAAASLSASAPASWNAMSDESTLCALPSHKVTRRSTTGKPAPRPFAICARTPFSTDGMN